MFDGPYEKAAPRRRFFSAFKGCVLPVARQDDDPISRDIALRLLGNPGDDEQAIDRLLSDPPAQEAVERGRNVILGFIMSEPEMDGLNAALGELLRAARVADQDWVGLAAVAVMNECNRLLREGYDGACLAALLRQWSRVTPGAPQINVVFENMGVRDAQV